MREQRRVSAIMRFFLESVNARHLSICGVCHPMMIQVCSMSEWHKATEVYGRFIYLQSLWFEIICQIFVHNYNMKQNVQFPSVSTSSSFIFLFHAWTHYHVRHKLKSVKSAEASINSLLSLWLWKTTSLIWGYQGYQSSFMCTHALNSYEIRKHD